MIKMALLTITQASKDFNIDKGKIYRAIKAGKMTAILKENIQYIDHSDMIRVFQSSKQTRTITNRTKLEKNQVHEPNELIVELLKKQLLQAEERERFYKQQIDEIREDFKSYRLLIEHKIPLESKPLEPNQTEKEPDFQTKKTFMETEKEPVVETPTRKNDAYKEEKMTKNLFGKFLNKILNK